MRTQDLTVNRFIIFFEFIFCLKTMPIADSFTPPQLGIASILFPVRDSLITGISDTSNAAEKRLELQEVSDFFVDAFWTAKVGGGARTLSPYQRQQLEQSQSAEFNKRYGSSRRVSEMLIMRSNKSVNEIIACAGVEVDRIPMNGSLKSPSEIISAPLMSNLAVSRSYRRRGLAEKMVQAVEVRVRKEWGYQECFLFVEERNRAAVQLYQKLGYRKVWRDADASTLLPTTSGDLRSAKTVILCMKKKLSATLFERMFTL